jgi:peroxiredoxin
VLNNIKIDRKFWINFIFFFLGGALLIFLYIKYRVAPEIKSDLQLKTLDGQVIKLGDLKGKTVFLNFFATWCGPCCDEMPTMEIAKANLDTSRIVFIAVSEEDPEKLKAFIDKNKYDFQFMTPVKTFKELGIATYPTTYIIDSKGHIGMTQVGAVDWSQAATIAQIRQIMEP